MDNPVYLPGQSAYEVPPNLNYGAISSQAPPAAGTYQPPSQPYQPPTVPNVPQPDEIKAALAVLSQATGAQLPPSKPKPAPAKDTKKPNEWVPLAEPVSNCPHGLEYLLQMNELYVDPHDEMMDEFGGYQFGPKFLIRNPNHQKIYFAAEESKDICRACCQPCHGFNMDLADQKGNVILKFERPYVCTTLSQYLGCFPCFSCLLHKMTISSADGTVIGYVEQEWSCFMDTPAVIVRDAEDEEIFKCEGPGLTLATWRSMNETMKEFTITTKMGADVGTISKKWSFLHRSVHGEKDAFKLKFPLDLDVKLKACLIGMTLLVDYLYFAGATMPDDPHRRRRRY